jgi:hypothetical protein
MKARTHLKKTGHSAEDLNPTGCGLRNAAKNLEKGTFTCTVPANDTNAIAASDLKIHILKCPKVFLSPGTLMGSMSTSSSNLSG